MKYESLWLTDDRKPLGLPTDGQTDRPTLAKQYAPSSSRDGEWHKNVSNQQFILV